MYLFTSRRNHIPGQIMSGRFLKKGHGNLCRFAIGKWIAVENRTHFPRSANHDIYSLSHLECESLFQRRPDTFFRQAALEDNIAALDVRTNGLKVKTRAKAYQFFHGQNACSANIDTAQERYEKAHATTVPCSDTE